MIGINTLDRLDYNIHNTKKPIRLYHLTIISADNLARLVDIENLTQNELCKKLNQFNIMYTKKYLFNTIHNFLNSKHITEYDDTAYYSVYIQVHGKCIIRISRTLCTRLTGNAKATYRQYQNELYNSRYDKFKKRNNALKEKDISNAIANTQDCIYKTIMFYYDINTNKDVHDKLIEHISTSLKKDFELPLRFIYTSNHEVPITCIYTLGYSKNFINKKTNIFKYSNSIKFSIEEIGYGNKSIYSKYNPDMLFYNKKFKDNTAKLEYAEQTLRTIQDLHKNR